MKHFSFCVDSDLRLLPCEGGAHDGSGEGPELPQGALYYELFPRIYHAATDAVLYAMEHGEPVTIKGYRLFCFYGEIQAADIEIVPLFDENSRCVGARVDVTPLPCCTLLDEIEHTQTLVDIGKVSVTLAHGVRNPLNAIKGAVVYLKEKYRSDAIFVEFADIIDEEIAKLDGFITEFLSTSCMGASRETVQLNELLGKIVKLVSLQAQASRIEFRTDFGELPPLSIDSFNMGHAILNVINNAIGAMAHGGCLTLRTALVQVEGADAAVIEISDTGTGMTTVPLEQPGGFPEPMVRRRGKGFGLFITREIVRHHGGRVEISSNREGGTTVRIMLPVTGNAECDNGK